MYQPHSSTAGAAGMSSTTAALLHDSSSAYVDFSSATLTQSSSSTNGTGSNVGSTDSSSSSGDSIADGHSIRPVGRSVPADQLTRDQIEQLRQTHKRRHKAAAAESGSGSIQAAAAAAGGVVGSDREQGSSSSSSLHPKEHSGVGGQHQQQQQQQTPPTWAYCSSGFYEASVWARLGLAVAFAVLVVLCQAPAGLLILALVNVCGALSMWGALRRQWLMHVMGDMPEAAGMSVSAS
jgi:hypothetical protein